MEKVKSARKRSGLVCLSWSTPHSCGEYADTRKIDRKKDECLRHDRRYLVPQLDDGGPGATFLLRGLIELGDVRVAAQKIVDRLA